jgi:hypothetical protein
MNISSAFVKARKAIESLYDGKCTITETQEVENEDHTTSQEDVDVYTDIPCRLSINTISAASDSDNGAASVSKVIKLFLSPDVTITSGAKVTVTQCSLSGVYRSASEPAMYHSHQEVILELQDRWS